MFAGLADSDSEEEMKTVETKTTGSKKKGKKPKKESDRPGGAVAYEQDEDGYKREVKEGQRRGARGGRRGGPRGAYRGGQRGHFRGGRRGRGSRGGRYRGGYGENRGPYEKYSRFGTRQEIHGDKKPEEPQEESEYHGRTHERRTGTGHGKEVKKGGAGKAGWGDPDEEKKYEHQEAENAVEEALATEEEKKKPEPVAEGEGEGEEEVSNYTYQDYLADKEKQKEGLTKAQARDPEAITISNKLDHEQKKDHVLGQGTRVGKHEAYSTGGIHSEVELGFAVGAPEDDIETYDRPPRRGQRGGYRGGQRGGHGHGGRGGGKGGHKKKFVPLDDDFPAL